MGYRYRLRYPPRTLLFALAVIIISSIPAIRTAYIRSQRKLPSTRWLVMNQLVEFDVAVKEYFIDVGELPASIDDLLSPPAQLSDSAKWAGPYLDENIERLDPWRKPINYEITDHLDRKYRIWSDGPDRLPWTRDDIVYRY